MIFFYHFEFDKVSLQNINLVGVPKRGKDKLIVKHLSGPIEHKIKIKYSPVKEAQNQRGQMSLGKEPKQRFVFFLKPPLSSIYQVNLLWSHMKGGHLQSTITMFSKDNLSDIKKMQSLKYPKVIIFSQSTQNQGFRFISANYSKLCYEDVNNYLQGKELNHF